ncbi:sodium- and chloride-dependent GABA transporter 1-like isoform X1 [Scylla paramamosain]|uniref:sodium- and chloride-dependent GABA transporter 1-like isoform X1 n=1 Tax=Scylla paramamosain TaxID=85552 RepID=UPI003082B990
MYAWLVDWLCRPLPERGVYKNSKEAFLALVGFSVGLGNFWRFPTSSFEYEGATFLIAYIVCLLSIGLPLVIMEISLGQYLGLGPAHLFSRMCPVFSGVGWAMVLQLLMITVYYNIILSWTLFYLGGSFLSPLPWSHYRHEHDSGADSLKKSYESAGLYFNQSLGGLPVESENPYELHPRMVLCLAVAWVLVVVCLVKGVRHTGNVFYVTVLYPYVVLLCLFGLNYKYINLEKLIANLTTVNFEKLKSLKIYSEAASQTIYSLGVGHGIVMVASHNQIQQNVIRDSILLCLMDVVTSFFCMQVVFSVWLSVKSEIEEDIKDISGLVFKVFSALLAYENTSLWAFLFFSVIFALGFDSQLLMVAGVTTSIFDQYPQLRPYHPFVIAFTCFALFLLGLTMCTKTGIIIFNMMNTYTLRHSMFFLTLLEVVIASYLYGYRNIFKLMKKELKLWLPLPIRWYLTATWTVITPLYLAVTFGYFLYSEDWSGPKDVYFIIGQVIAFGPMVLVPLFALHAACTKEKNSVSDLLRARNDFHTSRYREDDFVCRRMNAIPMHNFAFSLDSENYI